jgi:DNA-binding CsgD family transcriptional regulator
MRLFERLRRLFTGLDCAPDRAVRLPAELYDRLAWQARQDGLSPGVLISGLLWQAVEQQRLVEGARGNLGCLSPRELEVARLAGQGLSNLQIAAGLSLSPNTVKTHLCSAQIKLGLPNRALLCKTLADGDSLTDDR